LIVYKISNMKNLRVYIGITTQKLLIRWAQHKRVSAGNKKLRSLHFDIKKYGKENFTIEAIETCSSRKVLNSREKFWIKKLDSFNNGYNLTTGGGRNFKMSEDTKRKISIAKKGKMSKEQRASIKKATKNNKNFLGYKHTDTTKKEMSKNRKGRNNSMFGKEHTDITKKKISKSKVGKLNPKFRGKGHPLFRGYYTTPLGVFESSRLAATANKCNQKTILNRIKNVNFPNYSFLEEK